MTTGLPAVILAAGRGSRMGSATAEQPKCLTPLLGRPLLSWQLDALTRAGCGDVTVIGGYRAEDLIPLAPHLLVNERWDRTNMVGTLRRAHDLLSIGPTIVAYGDIVYRANHVRRLAASTGGITITADTRWLDLWSARFADPLDDAETFRHEDGRLTAIGARPEATGDVQAQFMGLLRLTPGGWQDLSDLVTARGDDAWDSLDMTGLLAAAVADGIHIDVVEVAGGWAEVDEVFDRDLLEVRVGSPGWLHDWREEDKSWV